ncbi:hypothetical protein GCM10018966_006200 [Streptomyces yanii]
MTSLSTSLSGFARDQWYVVVWSAEVGRELLGRTVPGEPLALYRTEDGRAVALADHYVHRRANLSIRGVMLNARERAGAPARVRRCGCRSATGGRGSEAWPGRPPTRPAAAVPRPPHRNRRPDDGRRSVATTAALENRQPPARIATAVPRPRRLRPPRAAAPSIFLANQQAQQVWHYRRFR